MKSFACNKKVSVRPGNLSIGRMLLAGSLVLAMQSALVEAAVNLASPCTLAWNQCPNSSASGYALYFGIVGSTTTNRLDAGNTNQVTIKSLLATSNYFFAVVAYNSSGIESPRSSVMNYTPQALSALKLTGLAGGAASLHFLAATGAVCQVQYTSTLNPPQWQTLCSATADANGNITISDPLSGSYPSRFYRVTLP